VPESLILGGGIHPFARYKDASSPRDWSRAAVAEALAEADIGAQDLDTVIVAVESDHLMLQLSPAALLADELALLEIPVLRVESGGASGAMAIRMAHAHVQARMARCVLVLGVEHAASHLEAADTGFVYGLSFDPDLEGFAGVTPANAYALSMRAHTARYGTTEEQLASVSIKNHGNAVGNPAAHVPLTLTTADVLASPIVSSPYKRLDCSPLSDGASALVVAASDWGPKRRGDRVRLAGAGSANDFVHLGDRPEPYRFAAKALAAQRAYAQAGIENPQDTIDIAEVYDAFSGAEIQALEDLGLGSPGEVAAATLEGRFASGGALPVNLSGGLIGQGGAPGATGVAQVVTLARLLTQSYWSQPANSEDFRWALADCHGGVATVCVVHVLERMETRHALA